MDKKSAYKIIILPVVLVICLFVLEKIFDFGIKHNLNLKSAYVAANSINASLLVLGPCEPLWMVSPEILTKKMELSCYNLANSHSDFADNYLHLYLYLKNNKAPEYLLLFVTPESFDTRYNTFYSYRFAPFLNDTLVSETVSICDKNFYRCTYIPFMKYGYYSHQSCFLALQGWKHYLSGRQNPYYADGFEPPAKIVWDNHHENLKKAYPKGYSFTWDSLRAHYLQKIIDLCKQKNIKVIFYESPVLKEIADYQYNRTLFLEKIDGIAKQNGLKFLKFENITWAKERKYFVSPMVTTLHGSYIFSDTLGLRLRGIIAH